MQDFIVIHGSGKKVTFFRPPIFLTFFFRKHFLFFLFFKMYWSNLQLEYKLFVEVITPWVGWYKSLCTKIKFILYVLYFFKKL